MSKPWIKDGLFFKCTGCGKCCTGSPGYVFLAPRDLTLLANHVHLSEEEFIKHYTHVVEDQLSLIDSQGTDACIFLKDNKCSVYESRPIQCRTFPWWAYHLENKKSWERAGIDCEGINHPEASLVPILHIEEQLATYLDNLLEQNFSS